MLVAFVFRSICQKLDIAFVFLLFYFRVRLFSAEKCIQHIARIESISVCLPAFQPVYVRACMCAFLVVILE